MPKNERKIKIKQLAPLMGGEACPERSEGTKVRVNFSLPPYLPGRTIRNFAIDYKGSVY